MNTPILTPKTISFQTTTTNMNDMNTTTTNKESKENNKNTTIIIQPNSGNDPNDPMSKYDNIAPELGVGIERWNAIRNAWINGNNNTTTINTTTTSNNSVNKRSKNTPLVDVDSVVEHLVNPKKPAFQHAVPLPEMIHILIEIWETDGIYD